MCIRDSYKDGKKHGQGTLTSPDGSKYEGGWNIDRKHGQGSETFGKGKFEGCNYVG